jgi:hypothetical protein
MNYYFLSPCASLKPQLAYSPEADEGISPQSERQPVHTEELAIRTELNSQEAFRIAWKPGEIGSTRSQDLSSLVEIRYLLQVMAEELELRLPTFLKVPTARGDDEIRALISRARGHLVEPPPVISISTASASGDPGTGGSSTKAQILGVLYSSQDKDGFSPMSQGGQPGDLQNDLITSNRSSLPVTGPRSVQGTPESQHAQSVPLQNFFSPLVERTALPQEQDTMNPIQYGGEDYESSGPPTHGHVHVRSILPAKVLANQTRLLRRRYIPIRITQIPRMSTRFLNSHHLQLSTRLGMEMVNRCLIRMFTVSNRDMIRKIVPLITTQHR